MKTAPESRTVEFGEIYNRLTQRFMPASVPKQVSRKVLAISQVVLAFQHLQDSLRRVVGIFQDRPAGAASLPDAGMRARVRAGADADAAGALVSIESLLRQLGALAHAPQTGWQKDLQVMIARAEAAREVLDLLLFSRPASAQALILLGLPKALTSAEQIEHFADEVGRLDAAFFALGAQYVLDRHYQGVGQGILPLPASNSVQPRRRTKRESAKVTANPLRERPQK
ncbi:hypothetical protein [Burkholderia sp. L27(2015)]|uniref:hypothetical protein n=1 Tax=Burkholderia sp. L27(2015) TaxID=1641858 RepID=UPI00131E36B6|nr:hypothetical protein [Burkholderia sp. L27(2015)]